MDSCEVWGPQLRAHSVFNQCLWLLAILKKEQKGRQKGASCREGPERIPQYHIQFLQLSSWRTRVQSEAISLCPNKVVSVSTA